MSKWANETKMASQLLVSFGEIAAMTAMMLLVTYTGCFNDATTEDGTDHYAETPLEAFPYKDVIPMPFNTVINLGYVLVGILWLYRGNNMEKRGLIPVHDAHMLFGFSWMAVAYGFIQMTRILTQMKYWAIMDQWYTLPFFAWAILWCLDLWISPNKTRDVVLIVASLLSYCAALYDEKGFEKVLGMHILIAIFISIQMIRTRLGFGIVYASLMAYTSCTLFVVLKVLDHRLAASHPFFTIISGHFLSKIADVGQIHYTAMFMIYYIKGRPMKGKSTKKTK